MIYPVKFNPLGTHSEVAPELIFYLNDHLRNTRATLRGDEAGAYFISYAADYLPFGKVLREFKPCDAERFLTTLHERDTSTGYDNRGARLCDSEIGRFMGVDPLASQFPGWSTYNYVLNNPLIYTDPDGRMPGGPGDGILGKLSSFYDKFKEKGLGAVKDVFTSVSSLFTGSNSERAEASALISSVPASMDRIQSELVEATFESARMTTQAVGGAAEKVEIAAIGTTLATGGTSSSVTVPIAGAADIVGTGALILEGGVDILQEGSLRPETQQAWGLKAVFGIGGRKIGKHLNDAMSGSPRGDQDAVQGVVDAAIKTAEAATPVVIDKLNDNE